MYRMPSGDGKLKQIIGVFAKFRSSSGVGLNIK
jgi:hypothetical protein